MIEGPAFAIMLLVSNLMSVGFLAWLWWTLKR